MADTIHINGLRAIGRHGVLPEEQRRGQPFQVDLALTIDLASAAASDDLADTVDYGTLAEAIVRTIELESFQLLEKLADRIAKLARVDGRVSAVEVTVRKLRPPVPLDVDSVGVTVRR